MLANTKTFYNPTTPITNMLHRKSTRISPSKIKDPHLNLEKNDRKSLQNVGKSIVKLPTVKQNIVKCIIADDNRKF